MQLLKPGMELWPYFLSMSILGSFYFLIGTCVFRFPFITPNWKSKINILHVWRFAYVMPAIMMCSKPMEQNNTSINDTCRNIHLKIARAITNFESKLIWAASSENVPSSMRKICGFTSSCTRAKISSDHLLSIDNSIVSNESVSGQ